MQVFVEHQLDVALAPTRPHFASDYRGRRVLSQNGPNRAWSIIEQVRCERRTVVVARNSAGSRRDAEVNAIVAGTGAEYNHQHAVQDTPASSSPR